MNVVYVKTLLEQNVASMKTLLKSCRVKDCVGRSAEGLGIKGIGLKVLDFGLVEVP